MEKVENIPLVILAGGKGTRISEYTQTIPKPMIKIGKKPIIKHIIDYYKLYGVKNFFIASGYKQKFIKQYFKKDSSVNVIFTGSNSMTGGRLLRLKKYLKSTFFLTYGDGLSDINITKLYQYHLIKKKIATVTAVHPVARFGEVKFNKDKITSFNEKPRVKNDWINGGFFVFEKEIFSFLKNDMTILENQPLRNLVKKKQLNGFKHDGFWQCMDTVRERVILENLYKSDICPWKKKIVFIASASSFLGKELIKNFLKKKYFIITYSNYQLPIKKNNYVRFNNLNKLANFLKNIKKINLLFLNNGVIGNEYEFNYLIRSHLIKTFNILKITKNIKIERLIYFCSADENGFSNTTIKETNIIYPQNKYGLIKSLTTKYIKNICNNRKINYTFFKLFLVVGKTQKEPRIFALIKKCILTNTTFLIKTPNHFKNILYIDDFISIINKTIANKKTINEEYNLGSDLNIRMIDLCKQIKKYNPEFSFKKLKFNEIKKQVPDISKLQKIIGNFKFINIDKIIRLIL